MIKTGLHLSFFFWELITSWWCVTVIFLWSLNLEAVLPDSFIIFSCWHLQIYYLYRSSLFKAHEVNALFFYQLCFVFWFTPKETSVFSLMSFFHYWWTNIAKNGCLRAYSETSLFLQKKKKVKPGFRTLCYRGGKNVAGVNLVFYFACKSYRRSFSSVFRPVLKVTGIEAHVWVKHRCLYVALGRVCQKAAAGIILLLFFLQGDPGVWAQVPVPRAGQVYISQSPLWLFLALLWWGGREGRRGQGKRFGGVLQCLTIQVLLWYESKNSDILVKWVCSGCG